MIAGGGAFGGLFVACAAPLFFINYYELHCGIVFCAVLMVIAWAREPSAYLWRLLGPNSQKSPFAQSSGQAAASANAAVKTEPLQIIQSVSPGTSVAQTETAFDTSDLAPAPSSLAAHGPLPWLRSRTLMATLFAVASLALAASFWSQAHDSDGDKVHTSRNFYGVLTVFEHRKNEPNEHHFLLQHGRITHGLQFADPDESAWPTTYYGEDSGVGLALRALPASNRRIGLVGLGTGTLAAYGKAGDYLHIYEINPAVKRLSSSRFTYTSHSPAQIDIALGDARLSMEREAPQQFDLLVLDAFSSDAIPVHLLTKEAFQIYQRHLKANGIVAVHVSNHYLDLEPVVANLAQAFDYKSALIDYDETDEEWWLYSSTWILLTHDQGILDSPAIQKASAPLKSRRGKSSLWTDDFTSLYQILK